MSTLKKSASLIVSLAVIVGCSSEEDRNVEVRVVRVCPPNPESRYYPIQEGGIIVERVDTRERRRLYGHELGAVGDSFVVNDWNCSWEDRSP